MLGEILGDLIGGLLMILLQLVLVVVGGIVGLVILGFLIGAAWELLRGSGGFTTGYLGEYLRSVVRLFTWRDPTEARLSEGQADDDFADGEDWPFDDEIK